MYKCPWHEGMEGLIVYVKEKCQSCLYSSWFLWIAHLTCVDSKIRQMIVSCVNWANNQTLKVLTFQFCGSVHPTILSLCSAHPI